MKIKEWLKTSVTMNYGTVVAMIALSMVWTWAMVAMIVVEPMSDELNKLRFLVEKERDAFGIIDNGFPDIGKE